MTIREMEEKKLEKGYTYAQIAELSGFSNASRFAQAFRTHIGCNPGDYNSLNQSCLL